MAIDRISELERELADVSGKLEQARKYIDSLPANWHEDSSLETWFPFTAQELAALRLRLEEAERERAEWEAVAKSTHDEMQKERECRVANQDAVRASESRQRVLEQALRWALDHLKKFVTITQDGSAYIRGTGTELAGFAAKFHEYESALAQGEPARTPAQEEK